MHETENDIERFWDLHPCGEHQVGGVRGPFLEFFDRYDAFRYRKEEHILKHLRSVDWREKNVLEIGLGLGADSEQIIRLGAIWSGLDLTPTSVERVKTRLSLRGLPYKDLKQGSVLQIPYASGSFDIVFSHGVLHHVPDIAQAQSEIARVLKPGGRLVMMVYAKNSINYWLSIYFLRRLGLVCLAALGVTPSGIFGEHLKEARKVGLLNYLSIQNFINRNTDGPLNPYSKLYTSKVLQDDFPSFRLEAVKKDFMHAPPLRVDFAKFMAPYMGWHMWAFMTKA